MPAPARRWVLALTSVASLMVALDALVVSTALPVIRVEKDLTSHRNVVTNQPQGRRK